jgi:hypothetical protein
MPTSRIAILDGDVLEAIPTAMRPEVTAARRAHVAAVLDAARRANPEVVKPTKTSAERDRATEAVAAAMLAEYDAAPPETRDDLVYEPVYVASDEGKQRFARLRVHRGVFAKSGIGPRIVGSVRQTCPAVRRRGSSRQVRPVRRTRSSARSPGRQSDDPSPEPPPPELTALQLALSDLHRLDQRRQILDWREWRAVVDIVGAWVAHQSAATIEAEWGADK